MHKNNVNNSYILSDKLRSHRMFDGMIEIFMLCTTREAEEKIEIEILNNEYKKKFECLMQEYLLAVSIPRGDKVI